MKENETYEYLCVSPRRHILLPSKLFQSLEKFYSLNAFIKFIKFDVNQISSLMKNYRLRTVSFLIIIIFTLAEANACTKPDSAGTIKGKNTVCLKEKVSYKVPTIAFATGYKWTLPSGTQIISGDNTDSITLLFYGTSGGIIKVQGVNSCDTGVSSSFTVKVDNLPKINLISPQKYCCDYGDISLGSSNFGSPTGGTWTCRQNQNTINSNVFLVDVACNPAKTGVFTLKYTYQDPSTSCTNSDSTFFSINPLPAIKLKDGAHCQNENEVVLRYHVSVPANLNTMALAQWKLLKTLPKPGGGNNTINDLVYDYDNSLNYDYRLKVDTATIDIGTRSKDSLILELTIQNGQGCFNKDTTTIYILKAPAISFNIFPELCINKGKVSLKNISNVKPNDGCWKVINKSGYSDSVNLKQGIVDCDTLNTLLLNNQNGPGLYRMLYSHTSSGCGVSKETELRIYPLPKIALALSPNIYSGNYCEMDDDITLLSSPSGGTWSSSVEGVISGGFFKPNLVGKLDRDKWITLTYSYTNPKTQCDSSKSLKVFVQSTPLVKISNSDIDTCRSDVMEIKLRADYSFTSKITWVHSAGPTKASFENKQQLSYNNPTVFTIHPRNDSVSNITITVFTEAVGVCPIDEDNMNIKINLTPCDSTSSVQKLKTNKSFEVILFPNPARDKFNLEIKREGNYTVKLYTLEGKLLLEKGMRGFEPETLDLKLQKGYYMFMIESSDGFSVSKQLMVE